MHHIFFCGYLAIAMKLDQIITIFASCNQKYKRHYNFTIELTQLYIYSL